MRNRQRLFVIFILLLCATQLCNAQQEDTLKLRPHLPIPPLATPQMMQPNRSIMPDILGLDGLEYTSPISIDTTVLIPNLSIENFLKFYYDDFLEWEEDTYGWNFDLSQFTHKNGKYSTRSQFTRKKRGVTEPITDTPIPLAHKPNESPPAISIPISWKPSKHDVWFKENFGWEKRILYNNVSIERFDFRDPIEYQRVQIANSIIEQRKAELGGVYSPDLSNLKKRIKQIRSDIVNKAKFDIKPRLDSMP